MNASKLCLIFCSVFTFLTTSCNSGGEQSGDKTPTSITISGIENIPVGLEIKFETKIMPLDACLDVIWSSDDNNVASVNEYGWVKGISTGNTKIKATSKKSDSVLGTYDIKVYPSKTEDEFLTTYGNFYNNFLNQENPPKEMGGLFSEGDCYFVNGKVWDYSQLSAVYRFDEKTKRRTFSVRCPECGQGNRIYTKEEMESYIDGLKIYYQTVGFTTIKDFYYVDEEYTSYFVYASTDSGMYYYEYGGYDTYCYLIRNVEMFNGYLRKNANLEVVPVN